MGVSSADPRRRRRRRGGRGGEDSGVAATQIYGARAAPRLRHRPQASRTFRANLSLRPSLCCRFGGDELRVLEAALSAGGDVPALLATHSAARRLLRASAAEAFSTPGPVGEDGRRLAVADFFARAFALVGDVE
ncbi:hypothetical protein ACP70R_008774 [Stipagrostis hirtigluma subsp. patula]